MSFAFDKKHLEKNEKQSVNGDVVYEYKDEGFLDTLSEDEKKSLKELNEKKNKFIEEAATFSEYHCVEEMKNDKDIKSISYKYNLGDKKSNATIDITRSQTFTNKLHGDVQEVTKSKVKVSVTEPYSKLHHNFLDEMEKRLTKEFH